MDLRPEFCGKKAVLFLPARIDELLNGRSEFTFEPFMPIDVDLNLHRNQVWQAFMLAYLVAAMDL